jgi:hypothetical protein
MLGAGFFFCPGGGVCSTTAAKTNAGGICASWRCAVTAASAGRPPDTDGAATVVHHIWPAEDYPEYAYCLWNLVSLSASAHDAMHDRDTRKLTALGLSWKNRTPPTPSAEF